MSFDKIFELTAEVYFYFKKMYIYQVVYIYLYYFTLLLSTSGQAVVTGVVPSPPRFLPSPFIAHRVQQSHGLSVFHRASLTHAVARSASQFGHKKRSLRIYTRMHIGGLVYTYTGWLGGDHTYVTFVLPLRQGPKGLRRGGSRYGGHRRVWLPRWVVCAEEI